MTSWPERMLSKQELQEITQLSASTIEEQIRQGAFPRPRLISARRTAWLASEVYEWMRSTPYSDLPPPPNTGAPKPRESMRRAGAAARAPQGEHPTS